MHPNLIKEAKTKIRSLLATKILTIGELTLLIGYSNPEIVKPILEEMREVWCVSGLYGTGVKPKNFQPGRVLRFKELYRTGLNPIDAAANSGLKYRGCQRYMYNLKYINSVVSYKPTGDLELGQLKYLNKKQRSHILRFSNFGLRFPRRNNHLMQEPDSYSCTSRNERVRQFSIKANSGQGGVDKRDVIKQRFDNDRRFRFKSYRELLDNESAEAS